MSKVYKIIDPEIGEDLLASKEYVDLRVQALKTALLTHEQNTESAHKDSTNTVIDNAGLLDKEEVVGLELHPQMPKSIIEHIEQDAQHRFLTDTQIKAFKDKASTFEVGLAIEDAKNELKSSFNDQYINLLNLPNAINKLKEIAVLIKSSDVLNSLFDMLDNRITQEELEEHIASCRHLNNNDRKALNMLLEYINNGYAEKIKDIGKEAEHAVVSDTAKTLGGYSLEKIKTCHLDMNIYGSTSSNNLYDNASVNFMLDNDSLDGQETIKKIFCDGDLKRQYGVVSFKPGEYIINKNKMDLHRKYGEQELLIRGSGNSTVFSTEIGIDFNNVIIENLAITPQANNTTIEIYNDVKLIDTTFRDCNIIFKSSQRIIINRCLFYHCTFKFEDGCSTMIITNSFFEAGRLPKYLSRTNIITNNLEY